MHRCTKTAAGRIRGCETLVGCLTGRAAGTFAAGPWECRRGRIGLTSVSFASRSADLIECIW